METLFAAVELRQLRSDRTDPGPAKGNLPAPLDVEEMRRRLGDDDGLIAEVTAMFLIDCPARLAQIHVAVAARDRPAIPDALKGAASNLSATPVIECAGALESMAADPASDPTAADVLYRRLEVETARLLAALRAGLTTPARAVEQ